MISRIVRFFAGAVLTASLAIAAAPGALAQEQPWRIAKVSGQAWLSGDDISPVALTQEAVLAPGTSIRTGQNGRVMLTRGAESIVVFANTAISLPKSDEAGMSTVLQQAGSILLEVEKRNVRHFEVETPFLAAVVKGTRFRVTVQDDRAQVDVLRGQVQVSELRSGQFALVQPGQAARAAQTGSPGLSLSGSGKLGRIEQGPAQAPRIGPIAVPDGGLTPMRATMPAIDTGLRPALPTLAGQPLNKGAGSEKSSSFAGMEPVTSPPIARAPVAAARATPAAVILAEVSGAAAPVPDGGKRYSADQDIAKAIALVGSPAGTTNAKPIALALAAALGIAGAFSAGVVFAVARSRRNSES